MPIYEYRCTSCQAELEKLQKISDPPLVECPECGKDTLVKLISASSFRLKGSGWYETDFKTGKKKNGAAEESAGKTDSTSGPVAAASGDKAETKTPDSKVATQGSSNESVAKSSKSEAKSPGDTKGSSGSAGSQNKSS